MHGEKKQQITINCEICHAPQNFFVDLEDVAHGIADRTKEVRTEICVDRNGKPYLTPAEAELLISGTCDECWKRLCPSNKEAYN